MIRRDWSPDARIVLPVDGKGVQVDRDVPIRQGQAMDIYRPKDAKELRPAVLFAYGDAPPDVLRDARRWGQYTSWGEAVAADGLVAVVFDHASSRARTRMEAVVDDIRAAIDTIRQRGPAWGVDPDRLALWAGSAGVPYGTTVAMGASTPLRCLVTYYGTFDLRAWREVTPADVPDSALEEHSPLLVEGRPLRIPTLVVKAAQDRPEINDSIDAFVARARDAGSPITLLVHDDGRHGFDVVDDDDRSRQLIRETIEFLKRHLEEGQP